MAAVKFPGRFRRTVKRAVGKVLLKGARRKSQAESVALREFNKISAELAECEAEFKLFEAAKNAGKVLGDYTPLGFLMSYHNRARVILSAKIEHLELALKYPELWKRVGLNSKKQIKKQIAALSKQLDEHTASMAQTAERSKLKSAR